MINHRVRKYTMFGAQLCTRFYGSGTPRPLKCYLTCYLTAGMTNKSERRQRLFIFTRFILLLMPSKCYEYWSIDNARHTRLIRIITRPTGGHACNRWPHVEQIKWMEENCKIPCRTRPCRLTHVSRNYSSIYLAKVKF